VRASVKLLMEWSRKQRKAINFLKKKKKKILMYIGTYFIKSSKISLTILESVETNTIL